MDDTDLPQVMSTMCQILHTIMRKIVMLTCLVVSTYYKPTIHHVSTPVYRGVQRSMVVPINVYIAHNATHMEMSSIKNDFMHPDCVTKKNKKTITMVTHPPFSLPASASLEMSWKCITIHMMLYMSRYC